LTKSAIKLDNQFIPNVKKVNDFYNFGSHINAQTLIYQNFGNKSSKIPDFEKMAISLKKAIGRQIAGGKYCF
jgi:hypothetical protein